MPALGLLLTVHATNEAARAFYLSKGLEVSPISPSRCAPAAVAVRSTHELMQCLWDDDARVTMEKRGEAAGRRLREQEANHKHNQKDPQPAGGGAARKFGES